MGSSEQEIVQEDIDKKVDRELLDSFLEETSSLISSLEERLLELESDPQNGELLSELFRILHSIKGNTSLFGFNVGRNLAHELENYLSFLNENPRSVDKDDVSILFKGFDILKNYFSEVFEGKERKELNQGDNDFLKELNNYLNKSQGSSGEKSEELIKEVKEIVRTRLGDTPELAQILEDIGRIGEKREEINSVQELAEHNYFIGEKNITPMVSEIEHILQAASKDEHGNNEKVRLEKNLTALIDLLEDLDEEKDTLDVLQTFQVEFTTLAGDEIMLDELIAIDLFEKWQELSEDHFKSVKPVLEDQVEPKSNPKKVPAEAHHGQQPKFMRVDEQKIDGFMDYVGELIVTTEMFNFLERHIKKERFGNKEVQNAFHALSNSFNALSGNLQQSLLAVRRVPLKNLFTKLKRIVHDISKDIKKEINFQVEGGDEEIDKSLIELLDAPLLHLVRNSVDHGIEDPEEREARGKSRVGNIRIRAETKDDNILLTLTDDGKGIDSEKIRKNIITSGLVSEDMARSLSQEEIFDYVFTPGISTADKVTNISGRGVGMDVVKTNLEQANGKISIESEYGKSTKIVLNLPLAVTVTVKTALAVRVSDQELLISVEDIVEAFRPEADAISMIQGRGEIVRLRNKLYPLIRLADILLIPGAQTIPELSSCLVVRSRYGERVFMVDEIKGRQQVVMQDLGKILSGVKSFEGAAIRGNGEVGLVVNIERLVEFVES